MSEIQVNKISPSSGTALTLSGTHDEVDFVSFLVRSGSASTTVYATANKTFKY